MFRLQHSVQDTRTFSQTFAFEDAHHEAGVFVEDSVRFVCGIGEIKQFAHGDQHERWGPMFREFKGQLKSFIYNYCKFTHLQ